eukprot:gene12785-biopygen2237
MPNGTVFLHPEDGGAPRRRPARAAAGRRSPGPRSGRGGGGALSSVAHPRCHWRHLALKSVHVSNPEQIPGSRPPLGAMLAERSRTQNAAERERSRTRTHRAERRTQVPERRTQDPERRTQLNAERS